MKKSDQKSIYPLIESIGAWDGRTPFLAYHQERMDRTFEELYPDNSPFELEKILADIQLPRGKVKIRLLYNASRYSLEINKYERALINRLQIIEADDVSYTFKYSDRNQLKYIYEQRAKADDVLIFKNGLLTDAYYANIVCLIDQNLLTPTKPLLKGVMRAYLLDHKRIETANINRALLQRSKGVFLINALNPLRTSPFVPIEKIYF